MTFAPRRLLLTLSLALAIPATSCTLITQTDPLPAEQKDAAQGGSAGKAGGGGTGGMGGKAGSGGAGTGGTVDAPDDTPTSNGDSANDAELDALDDAVAD